MFSLKATLLSSGVADFCRAAEAGLQVKAHAASGIVWGHGAAPESVDRARATLEAWRKAAARHHGSVVVTRCPAPWKTSLDVWGPPRPDAALMGRVKAQFDPRGLFNPGRFVV